MRSTAKIQIKNIKIIFLIFPTIVGCSSDIEKLKSKPDNLTEKADKLTKEHIELLYECGSIKTQLILALEYKLNEHKLKKSRTRGAL